MNVLVTGSSGFLGKEVIQWLEKCDHTIKRFDRSNSDYSSQLKNIDYVVHCAGLVHSFENLPYSEYEKSNVALTVDLAKEALKQGISGFIFISTIKVYGEGGNVAITEDSPKNPQDPYSISKRKAEEVLENIFRSCEAKLFILRPPLIFGSGVKANLKLLINLIATSIPLPFRQTKNKRSLVFVKNFCHLIEKIISNPSLASNDFNVCDYTVSLYELTDGLKKALNSRTIIFYLPEVFLRLAFFLLGQRARYDRLYGSLYLDNSKLISSTNWTPPYSFSEVLKETVTNSKARG